MRLKLARIARRLTQAELGKLSGIGQAEISQIENGWIPPRAVQEKLAAALGLTVAELFETELAGADDRRVGDRRRA